MYEARVFCKFCTDFSPVKKPCCRHGAKIIYDTDDDNRLKDGALQ